MVTTAMVDRLFDAARFFQGAAGSVLIGIIALAWYVAAYIDDRDDAVTDLTRRVIAVEASLESRSQLLTDLFRKIDDKAERFATLGVQNQSELALIKRDIQEIRRILESHK